jgi:hypothetical protein
MAGLPFGTGHQAPQGGVQERALLPSNGSVCILLRQPLFSRCVLSGQNR